MHIADPRQVPSGIFLYTLRPARLTMLTEGPTAEEQALAARHWTYAARTIAETDPAVAGGVFQMRGVPFQPMLMDGWPPEASTVAPAA
jgi:hypothetical protein